MFTSIPTRSAMRQALEAALGACEGVLPAKGGASAEHAEPAFIVSPRLSEALSMAVDRHRSQVRKGTTIPYVTHLLAVTALVGESGGSEEEMIAALLHDAVEDGGGRPLLDEIRRVFGSSVADIVEGCSEHFGSGEKAPWLERKQSYLTRLAEAPLTVLRVTCADKLHNALSIARDLKAQGPSMFERFKGDREGTLWYYRSLARLYGALVQDEPNLDSGFRAVIRELRETVASLEG
jgi:(p)ppGpp synthase/HD superfamily hydrolase